MTRRHAIFVLAIMSTACSFILNCTSNITSGTNHQPISANAKTNSPADTVSINEEFSSHPSPTKSSCATKNDNVQFIINFNLYSAEIDQEGTQRLKMIANFYENKGPQTKNIEIIGYSHTKESVTPNISRVRADAVGSYLQELGISSQILNISSHRSEPPWYRGPHNMIMSLGEREICSVAINITVETTSCEP